MADVRELEAKLNGLYPDHYITISEVHSKNAGELFRYVYVDNTRIARTISVDLFAFEAGYASWLLESFINRHLDGTLDLETITYEIRKEICGTTEC